MRTIIGAYLLIFLLISVCPAEEVTDQNDCPEWAHFCPSECPARKTTGTAGEKILAMGNKIVDSPVKWKGACWDFVKAVYCCAGYKERTSVFGSPENWKKKDSYLEDMDKIQAGDWIMYVNLEYDKSGNTPHSAIFVSWIDKKQKTAHTLDYVGNTHEGKPRCEGGRRSTPTLNTVYCIERAVEPRKKQTVK